MSKFEASIEKKQTMNLWRSPGGILHRRQRCSANGRPKDTKKIKITREEYDRAIQDRTMCRCVRFAGWRDD